MTSLSASIMAHPVREQYVTELLTQLDRPVPVSWDEEGPPNTDKQKRWRNGRRAWEMATGEWHLVLQDDATVCADLLAGLEKALDHVPDDVGIVQPYFGTKRPMAGYFLNLARRAEDEGATWIRYKSMCWGVAIAVRSETIPAMVKWCDQKVIFSYDTRVGRYYRDVLGQYTFYTWPSLVDHRAGSSLVGHGTGRIAHRMLEGSALDLDWAGSVVWDERPIRRSHYEPRRRMKPIVKG